MESRDIRSGPIPFISQTKTNLMNIDPKPTFWNGILAGIVGLATMAIVFTLAPSGLGGPIGVCIGWAVFLGLWLHLTKVLRVANPDIEYVVMAVLSVQLLAMGVLSPWFGWTTEMLSGWFGRFFFAIYVLGPMILIPSLSIWRRVWRKPIT
jgi:hypothetical protein